MILIYLLITIQGVPQPTLNFKDYTGKENSIKGEANRRGQKVEIYSLLRIDRVQNEHMDLFKINRNLRWQQYSIQEVYKELCQLVENAGA